jgi:hypothetical protein
VVYVLTTADPTRPHPTHPDNKTTNTTPQKKVRVGQAQRLLRVRKLCTERYPTVAEMQAIEAETRGDKAYTNTVLDALAYLQWREGPGAAIEAAEEGEGEGEGEGELVPVKPEEGEEGELGGLRATLEEGEEGEGEEEEEEEEEMGMAMAMEDDGEAMEDDGEDMSDEEEEEEEEDGDWGAPRRKRRARPPRRYRSTPSPIMPSATAAAAAASSSSTSSDHHHHHHRQHHHGRRRRRGEGASHAHGGQQQQQRGNGIGTGSPKSEIARASRAFVNWMKNEDTGVRVSHSTAYRCGRVSDVRGYVLLCD